MLLCKVASEAAHKDILRDELEDLREGNREKFELLGTLLKIVAHDFVSLFNVYRRM